jgi:CRP-like cAMP-binding protein
MDTSPLRYPGAVVEHISQGETIFQIGSIGMHMFVVLKGQVQITVGAHIVDVINPGGIFGEMALVDDNPRAATATAMTDGELLRLDEKQFIKLVRESPEFALKVVRTLVTTVRRTDDLTRLAQTAEPHV